MADSAMAWLTDRAFPEDIELKEPLRVRGLALFHTHRPEVQEDRLSRFRRVMSGGSILSLSDPATALTGRTPSPSIGHGSGDECADGAGREAGRIVAP